MFKQLKDKLYILKYWKGLMFNYPKLTLESVDYDEYWRAKRGSSMGELSDWQLDRSKFVVKTLRGKAVESLCDIAAGEGAILDYIGRELGVKKLIGTDISDVAIERIKSFGIEGIKLDIGEVEDLNNIPVADYGILFEILEHVPHSELLLKEAFAKSRKGVFFSFPNTGFFPHRWRLLFGRFPMQWKLFPGEHVRFWTKRDLHWWLGSLGYRDYVVHYYKGVPILNKMWPSLFAAGFVVFMGKSKA
jgi:2-polyprenyl-3-methyl-5-hydroxy-6-metoxy-1,4-benzoquinol methylase